MRLHTNTAELADDPDVLNAAGWPISRIRRELTDEQIEEMIDTYLARSDDAVAGALATILEEGQGHRELPGACAVPRRSGIANR